MTGLSLGRIAVGAAALANPRLVAGGLGLDLATNPQAGYVGRLFGAREVALGALTLASRGPARRNLVLAGLAVDAADAATGVLGIRDKTVSAQSGAMLITPAVGAILSGIVGLRGVR